MKKVEARRVEVKKVEAKKVVGIVSLKSILGDSAPAMGRAEVAHAVAMQESEMRRARRTEREHRPPTEARPVAAAVKHEVPLPLRGPPYALADSHHLYVPALARDTAIKVIKERKIAVIHGATGCGKTSLAHLLIRDLGFTPRIWSETDTVHSDKGFHRLKGWMEAVVQRDAVGTKTRWAVVIDDAEVCLNIKPPGSAGHDIAGMFLKEHDRRLRDKMPGAPTFVIVNKLQGVPYRMVKSGAAEEIRLFPLRESAMRSIVTRVIREHNVSHGTRIPFKVRNSQWMVQALRDCMPGDGRKIAKIAVDYCAYPEDERIRSMNVVHRFGTNTFTATAAVLSQHPAAAFARDGMPEAEARSSGLKTSAELLMSGMTSTDMLFANEYWGLPDDGIEAAMEAAEIFSVTDTMEGAPGSGNMYFRDFPLQASAALLKTHGLALARARCGGASKFAMGFNKDMKYENMWNRRQEMRDREKTISAMAHAGAESRKATDGPSEKMTLSGGATALRAQLYLLRDMLRCAEIDTRERASDALTAYNISVDELDEVLHKLGDETGSGSGMFGGKRKRRGVAAFSDE